MKGLTIVKGQEIRTELFVIFEIEGAACLESHAECGYIGCFGVDILAVLSAAELAL